MLTTLPQSPSPLPASPAPADSLTSGRRAWIWLALLTLLGGALRFTLLDRPTLWFDESMTLFRTCGTYRQLLDVLQLDGFGPLHYELYWLLARVFDMSPVAMRFVPALAGTLTIPAIYFLASHLVARRTALLAAAITATSAFMLTYSRDAKMYAAFWLFVTLHMGCMLWWFQTHRRIAWLAWLTTGLAMVGLQGLGLIILALEPIVLLTYWPPSWRRALLLVLGLAIITAAPLGYYLGFNRLNERIEKRGFRGSPIFWVPLRNAGASGPRLLYDSTSCFLFGWQWIPEVKDLAIGANALAATTNPSFVPAIPPIPRPDRVTAAHYASAVLLFWLALGMVPWPQHWRPWGWERLAPHPWWRTAFWLSLWIIIPTYGFYCISMRHFVPPTYWIDAFLVELHRPITLILSLAGAATLIGTIWVFAPDFFQPHVLRARISKLILLLLVAFALFGLCHLLYSAAHHVWEAFVIQTLNQNPTMTRQAAEDFVWDNKWNSMWIPRYLAIIWPAVAIAAAALIMRLPFRPLRWAAIACFLGINLIQVSLHCYFASSEPPIDRIAADVAAARDPAGPCRTYVFIPRIGLGNPGTATLEMEPGRYYLFRAHNIKPTNDPSRRALAFQSFRILPKPGTKPTTRPTSETILEDLQSSPNTTWLIVWDRLETQSPDDSDPLALALGHSWERLSEQLYPVRVHWNWQDLYTARRREYIRLPPPATQPTTAPTTRPFSANN